MKGFKQIDWEMLLVVLTIMMLVLIAVTVLVVSMSHASTCLTMQVQPSQVLGNYDGDTFTVSLGALGRMIVRVEGVDTPEITKHQPKSEEAKAFTAKWLADGPFDLSTCFVLTLGRVVGAPSRNGETLASALIAAGFVKP